MDTTSNQFWFPGKYVGGISLILAPVVFLAGILLRIQFHFFFPDQLSAYKSQPGLIFASYSLFLAGNILLWPAIVSLAHLIGQKKPNWAIWGASLVLFGLFARAFHAGVDHMAFQIAGTQNVKLATQIVADSYGGFHVAHLLSGTIMFGWIVLAIGAYLSGVLNAYRAIALGLMSILMMGVLKGTSYTSVAAALGLCIALVPLGVQMLNQGSSLGLKSKVLWAGVIAGLVTLLYLFGEAG
ncbi:MAG TPA: hypothetical protein VK668_22125 [Mucilaginibacter sp.]|nr:hypothetical protein [Mucilaginibacter sp.]